MQFSIRKLFLALTFNLCLFLMLIIGIQNSSRKDKVSFIIRETVSLPISFWIGISFISGSIAGSLLTINLKDKKD